MKTHLKLAIIITLTIVNINVEAQNKKGKIDDTGRIALNAYVSPQVEGLPSSAKRMLINKLAKIVSNNGLGSGSINSRFIITPNITVLTKDLTSTAPPMTALTLDITFYIGDGIEGILFANTSLEVKGVGTNETKAYIAALKQIKAKNSVFKDFIDQGKTKIIEYYNTNCDFLQKDALVKADKKEFEDAISSLLAIPEVCKECYMSSQDLTVKIFKMKMENECLENIQKATVAKTNNEWDEAASYLTTILPDVSCYEDAQKLLVEIENHRCAEALGKAKGAWANMDSYNAAYWLSEISADSKCYKDALTLGNEIKIKLKEEEDKEWDFKLKEQQDVVDVQKATIKAARDIGVAYGDNQPKTVTYNTRSWW
ncbi:MAG: hypothetical protein L3J09_01210 [Flavobacteriaceae bacterium]|nr:hypothetical protein [Flavobacteriaceae bacterium]